MTPSVRAEPASAIRAASSAARSDSGDRSTPTTMGFPAMMDLPRSYILSAGNLGKTPSPAREASRKIASGAPALESQTPLPSLP